MHLLQKLNYNLKFTIRPIYGKASNLYNNFVNNPHILIHFTARKPRSMDVLNSGSPRYPVGYLLIWQP